MSWFPVEPLVYPRSGSSCQCAGIAEAEKIISRTPTDHVPCGTWLLDSVLYAARVGTLTRTTLLLVLTAFVAHIGALQAGWIWDDNDYITNNPVLQSPNGWLTCWVPGATPQYYPLVFLGFWIEHAAVGLDPLVYHLNNLLLHIGSTLLLWRILCALRVPHATWIAVIFTVHPMGVESVAWATERKNVQSLFLALASILCFIHASRGVGRRALALHGCALALYAGALLSKTTAVFVAPALVLIDLHDRRHIDARRALHFVPYFVTGLVLGLVTALVEKIHVGARGDEFAMPIADRLLLAGRNLVFYISQFAVPAEQIFVYPRTEISLSRMADWIPFAVMFLLLVVCAREWRRSRAPMLILLWTCAALFPALGFFDVWPFRYSFVADHFAYAAMPALSTGFVLLAVRLVTLVRGSQRVSDIAVCAFAAACVPLSWIASAKYAGVEQLWRDTIARNPSAWLAQNNLASELLAQASLAIARGDGDRARSLAEEALVHASIAFELKPDEASHPSNVSEALRLLGRFDESLVAIDSAVELQPAVAEFRWMRGRILESLGREDEARMAFEAVAADEMDASHQLDAQRSLVSLALKRKDLGSAVRHAREVLALTPGSPDALANLGALLAMAGERDEAMRLLRSALVAEEGFQTEASLVATAIGYLRLVVEGPVLAAEPESFARALAAELAAQHPSDPVLRFLSLAMLVRNGDARAMEQLRSLETRATEAGADALRAEIAAFVARRSGGA